MIYPVILGLSGFVAVSLGAVAGDGAWATAQKVATCVAKKTGWLGQSRTNRPQSTQILSSKELVLASGLALLQVLAVSAVAIYALSLTSIPLGVGVAFATSATFLGICRFRKAFKATSIISEF